METILQFVLTEIRTFSHHQESTQKHVTTTVDRRHLHKAC